MGNPIADQKAFMQACDQFVSDKGNVSSFGLNLYRDLVDEEFDELKVEIGMTDDYDDRRQEICKEIIDCIVVLIGLGYSYGFDMQTAWDAVHENNMTKVDPETGKVRRREDGKILKPDDYKPPCMKAAVKRFVKLEKPDYGGKKIY